MDPEVPLERAIKPCIKTACYIMKVFIIYMPHACYLPVNMEDMEDYSLIVKKGKNTVFLILDENHCSNREIKTNDKRLRHIRMT